MKNEFNADEYERRNEYGQILNQIHSGSSVLICGCATEKMAKPIKEELGCRVYIIESEQDSSDMAKQYADGGACADFAKDSWIQSCEGMQFDHILFTNILEKLADPQRSLALATSLLKHDGSVLVLMPNARLHLLDKNSLSAFFENANEEKEGCIGGAECVANTIDLMNIYGQCMAHIRSLEEKNNTLSAQYAATQKSLQSSELMGKNLRNSYNQLKNTYDQIACSRGWRMLSKYYAMRERFFPKNSIIRKILKTIAWLVLGKRQSPQNNHRAGLTASGQDPFELINQSKRIDILTVPHTMYIARLLKKHLEEIGVECCILTAEPEQYEDIPYIIICAQIFKRFPEVYIAFQMEQTINSRWLTETYMDILHNAYAVFDYSLENIDFFRKDPELASKMYYVPVDVCTEMMENDFQKNDKTYDVLFYGDIHNKRRQEYLNAIGENFKLHIASEVYGQDLYAEMNKAKIVVNIHYYEDALLETTRLYETLSVSDCLIISERSGDPREEAYLENIVDFVDVGNVEAMVERIRYWLAHEEERAAMVAKNQTVLKNRANASKFYFYRFFLANDRITFDTFYEKSGDFVHFDSDRVCLSLPESTDRRAAFDADNVYGFEVFPGLKHRFGWVGCGMSYKFMLRKAMEQQMEKILICEDDVYFPPDFDKRFAKVIDYLEKHDDWTVFSGIMADLGRITPLKYVEENGEEYIYLDKMISMVFNLYDKSIFEEISNWDYMNRDVQKNTIDRYLEKQKMRILTNCPFLVGHKEELNSTIWGGQNTIYTELIENSSVKLGEIVDNFKKTQINME